MQTFEINLKTKCNRKLYTKIYRGQKLWIYKKSKELSKITNKPEQNIIVQKINLKLSTEYITSFHLT